MQNPDLSWTTVATGSVDADGNFSIPVTVPAGATFQVVVTPGSGYAPGATAPQIATG